MPLVTALLFLQTARRLPNIAEAGHDSYIIGIDSEGSNRQVLAKRPIESGFDWIVRTFWSPSCSILAKVLMSTSSKMPTLFLSPSPQMEKPYCSRLNFNDGRPRQWATLPITGGELKLLHLPIPAAEVRAFRWSPDGKSIVYAKNE